MSKTHTTNHVSDGKVYTTETTNYKDGGSKSVTREGGDVLPPFSSKTVKVTERDSKGNSRTKRYK